MIDKNLPEYDGTVTSYMKLRKELEKQETSKLMQLVDYAKPKMERDSALGLASLILFGASVVFDKTSHLLGVTPDDCYLFTQYVGAPSAWFGVLYEFTLGYFGKNSQLSPIVRAASSVLSERENPQEKIKSSE